jgi:hypothetical protein
MYLSVAQQKVIDGTTEDAYWNKVIVQVHEGTSIIAGGVCSHIAPEHLQGMRGYGGRCWRITYTDGREQRTSNLWHGGAVPEAYRDRLPDNATVVQVDTVTLIGMIGL